MRVRDPPPGLQERRSDLLGTELVDVLLQWTPLNSIDASTEEEYREGQGSSRPGFKTHP